MRGVEEGLKQFIVAIFPVARDEVLIMNATVNILVKVLTITFVIMNFIYIVFEPRAHGRLYLRSSLGV